MSNINDNKESSASQNAMIREYLLAGGSLTPMDALNMFGCFRLASRIYDLRERGMDIKVERIIVPSGKRVARYSLR